MSDTPSVDPQPVSNASPEPHAHGHAAAHPPEPPKTWFWHVQAQAQFWTFLTVVGALFYWGHQHHWNLSAMMMLESHGHHGDAHHGDAHHAHGDEHHDLASTDAKPGEPHTAADATKPESLPIVFSSTAAVEKAGIRLTRVERKPNDTLIEANGVIDYDRTRLAQLSARVPGTVWRVEKRTGEIVRKGDVLALVESVEVGKAKSELLQSLALVDLRDKVLSRLEAAANSVPLRQLQEAEAALRESRIRLFTAQQALMNLGMRVNVKGWIGLDDEELFKRGKFLGLPDELAKTLDAETLTANLIPLIAPFDGVVIGREVAQGEVVEPSRAQFVVADVSQMWITLSVRKEDTPHVVLGQELKFTIDGLAGEVRTKVSWISTEADEKTRTVEVRAEADNPIVHRPVPPDRHEQRLLRANAYGTGWIHVGTTEQVVVVPTNSVQTVGTKPVVFVAREDGKTFDARPVRVGNVRDGWTVIREGLNEGERIVTQGSLPLASTIIQRR